MLDEKRIRFHSDVMLIAEEYFASAIAEDAEPFVDKLFKEYQEAGSPKNCKKWLRTRLEGVYKFVEIPPIWTESEPEWPYLEGEPMIFITQIELPKNHAQAEVIGDNEVLYLFGGRKSCEGGFEIEYKVVSQFAHGG